MTHIDKPITTYLPTIEEDAAIMRLLEEGHKALTEMDEVRASPAYQARRQQLREETQDTLLDYFSAWSPIAYMAAGVCLWVAFGAIILAHRLLT